LQLDRGIGNPREFLGARSYHVSAETHDACSIGIGLRFFGGEIRWFCHYLGVGLPGILLGSFDLQPLCRISSEPTGLAQDYELAPTISATPIAIAAKTRIRLIVVAFMNFPFDEMIHHHWTCCV
jgi:hypothetical protein